MISSERDKTIQILISKVTIETGFAHPTIQIFMIRGSAQGLHACITTLKTKQSA